MGDIQVMQSQIAIQLSHREQECVSFISRGMTAKQIGKALNISNRTVETYLENVKRKLCCSNRAELLWKIATEKLTSPHASH